MDQNKFVNYKDYKSYPIEEMQKRSEEFLEDIELTQKIVDALNFKEMPPEDEKQLTAKEHKMMSALFGSYLDTYIKESGSLKAIVMRRTVSYTHLTLPTKA